MNTTNLTKTNIISSEQAALIEETIGCELNRTITLNSNIPQGRYVISPYTNIYNQAREFRGSFYVIRSVVFNHITGVLSITGRNRWKRSFITKNYQLQIIGYKLPTTKIKEGYVYGNAQLMN